MTRPDLDALEALIGKATPGPLYLDQYDYRYKSVIRANGDYYVGRIDQKVNWRNDAALIVAAVNALPSLIARVRELEAERDALRECVKAADKLRYNYFMGDGKLYDAARAKVKP